MSDSEKYESITDYLIHLSIEKKLSHTSLMNAYSGIKKFYAINSIKLDWEQICINCLGKKMDIIIIIDLSVLLTIIINTIQGNYWVKLNRKLKQQQMIESIQRRYRFK